MTGPCTGSRRSARAARRGRTAPARARSPSCGDDRLDRAVAGRQQDGPLGVAPAGGDDEPERGEHAGGARAQDGLDPELVGDLGRVQRPRPSECEQRVAARVDPALDRDHAQRPDHLGVRDADDAGGAGVGVEAELRRRAPRSPRAAASWSSATPPASGSARRADGRGRRSRRSPSARCRRARSRPVPGRRPPSAGRPAGRPPGRATRSSRRRRRRCERRASAARAADPRPHRRIVPGPRRHRRRTRRMTSRPCRSRARSARRRARARNAAPAAPAAGPLSTVQAAWPAAAAASIRPPFDCITAGSGSPVSRARSISDRR